MAAAGAVSVEVAAGVVSVVVVVVVDVSVGAVAFSVLDGLVVVVALLSVVELGCAAGIVDVSVDCATAAPIPASNAAAAARADNFFW